VTTEINELAILLIAIVIGGVSLLMLNSSANDCKAKGGLLVKMDYRYACIKTEVIE